MNESGLLYKAGDSRILCLNCIATYVEDNFKMILHNQCQRTFNIGPDLIPIIAKYTKGYSFRCCNSKCDQDIFIKDWYHWQSRLREQRGQRNGCMGDYLKFYYYFIDGKYIQNKKGLIEKECRFMAGKWMRIFCESCTKWEVVWHYPEGLSRCGYGDIEIRNMWPYRYKDRKRSIPFKGGYIAEEWTCINGNYDLNGECWNHYACNDCGIYISNKRNSIFFHQCSRKEESAH